jgi:hypothetical protein
MWNGIAIGIGNQRFGGSGFDADYQTILNLATTAGYTLPSSANQAKQNQLLLDLKVGGIWSRLDTFALFANDGSSNFALIDWKRTIASGSLVLYTPVNSPTWSSGGGFTTNGISSYINTNFNPFSGGFNYVRNDAGRFFWVDNRGLNNSIFEGIMNANNNSTINGSGTDHYINQGSTTLNTFADLRSDGFKAINRTSSTSVSLFNNNNTVISRTAASSAVGNGEQVIGARNPNSSTNKLFGAHRFRFYAMGANCVSQNTAFYNAINTYLS